MNGQFKDKIWKLVPLVTGVIIFWLGIDASTRIFEAIEAACESGPPCDEGVSGDLVFLRYIVFPCAISVPVALHLFIERIRNAQRS